MSKSDFLDEYAEWQHWVHYIIGSFFMWFALGLLTKRWLSWSQFWWFTLWYFLIDTGVHLWFTFTPIDWMRWKK